MDVIFPGSSEGGAVLTMTRAVECAHYLVGLAAAEEETEYLTPLRLQKLLYYVQGWSLALRDKPMFDDRIEAWPLGPVVPSVYHEFKHLRSGIIDPDIVEDCDLDPEDRTFVKTVWDAYKDYSAISLARMTHQEAPWQDARHGLAPDEKSEREITRESMRDFFSSLTAE